MEVMAKILFALNFLIGSFLLLGLIEPYTALSDGSFVNNPMLFTFTFVVNVACLYVFIEECIPYITVSMLLGIIFDSTILYLFVVVSVITLNVVTILSEFPLNISADKFPHLMILSVTCIYFICVVVVLAKNFYRGTSLRAWLKKKQAI